MTTLRQRAVMAAGIAFAGWLVFGASQEGEGEVRLLRMALGLGATYRRRRRCRETAARRAERQAPAGARHREDVLARPAGEQPLRPAR